MMKIPFVDLKKQYLTIKDDIDKAIAKVINDTAFIRGKHVEEFERAFEILYGVNHCIGVANGTDAIYIVLKMLGIGQGDEVITVSNSWISTSETISQTGAKPVFVDVDEYFTIDVEQIESKITEKTKAIIPVHLYGQMADILKIKEICEHHDLYLVEDTAQAHFSEFKGHRAGTIGDAATFSFYPGKNLGAYGDAGAIITNNNELAKNCRIFANHGALIKHQHYMEGINSRLDGIQAAILSAKLPYILEWTAARQQKAYWYNHSLKDITQITLPKIRPNSVHSYHLYVILTPRRELLQTYLEERGISTSIHYPTPLPLMPAYQYLGHTRTDFPVVTANQPKILSLPLYPELTRKEVCYIAKQIKDFFDA